ncbi:MAG TPA: nitronate monooxygenase, partial [Mycobacteriales bacterium]|nr:nitronate monooxygenase [Mycobacteriales bacterium]
HLAVAVAKAGAFAFLAGGYTTPGVLAVAISQVRSRSDAFGVNLFAPHVSPISEVEFRRYARRLQPEAQRWGVDLSRAPLTEDDDGWQDKLDLLLADPVPVVSVTFGLPRPADVTALRRAGSQVWVTVTTVLEARAAADAGADVLVVQGSAAGGHSGTHDALRRITPMPTTELTTAVVAATGRPVVAAGGVDGPRRVVELLRAGARAVAVGTLLLRTDESGASQTHKDALARPGGETVLTRAFTGRPARALRNAFIERHDLAAPAGYPAVHHLTRPLRAAAAAAGDPDGLHLWAGTGFRCATTGPARQVVAELARLL